MSGCVCWNASLRKEVWSMSEQAMNRSLSIETRIYPVKDHVNLLARASVTLGGSFAITGIQIRKGKEDQPFVSMPSRKVGDEYKDICYPCTKEFRTEFNTAILSAYEQKMAEQTQKQDQKPSQHGPEMSM